MIAPERLVPVKRRTTFAWQAMVSERSTRCGGSGRAHVEDRLKGSDQRGPVNRAIARRRPSDEGTKNTISGLPSLLGAGNMPGRFTTRSCSHGRCSRGYEVYLRTRLPKHRACRRPVPRRCVPGAGFRTHGTGKLWHICRRASNSAIPVLSIRLNELVAEEEAAFAEIQLPWDPMSDHSTIAVDPQDLLHTSLAEEPVRAGVDSALETAVASTAGRRGADLYARPSRVLRPIR